MTTITIPSYKILSIDTATVTMVIQFEGGWPLNHRAPTYNGAWLSGDALDAWIKNLASEQHHLALELNAQGNLQGAEAVQALLDPTGYDISHLATDPNAMRPL